MWLLFHTGLYGQNRETDQTSDRRVSTAGFEQPTIVKVRDPAERKYRPRITATRHRRATKSDDVIQLEVHDTRLRRHQNSVVDVDFNPRGRALVTANSVRRRRVMAVIEVPAAVGVPMSGIMTMRF